MTDPETVRRRLEERERDLSEQRDRLLHETGLDERIVSGPSETSHHDQHPGDAGSEAFEVTKDLSVVHAIEFRLADIARARARLDDGTYGRCEQCGEPIDPQRLEVLPEARYCLVDQERLEATGHTR